MSFKTIIKENKKCYIQHCELFRYIKQSFTAHKRAEFSNIAIELEIKKSCHFFKKYYVLMPGDILSLAIIFPDFQIFSKSSVGLLKEKREFYCIPNI